MSDGLVLACLSCGQRNRTPPGQLAGAKCAICGAGLVGPKVADLDPAGLAATRSDDLPLLVDFWAPWCGPCRSMAPEFSRAASVMAGRVRFAKIDTERFREVSAKFAIRGIPLLILFRKGREIGRLAGARPASGILDFLAASGFSPGAGGEVPRRAGK